MASERELANPGAFPETQVFQYEALRGADEIRLLVLQPGDRESPIEFSLVHASLEDNPIYEAISYAWGDPLVAHTVFSGGRAIKITTSLFTALRHLRYADKPRTVWADALCIDQSNISERG